MFDNEISNRIVIRKENSSEALQLDQRRVLLRENNNSLMAVSYVAPMYEIFDLERFFDTLLACEKLSMDIGDTGEFTVSFRGMVDGKGKKLPHNVGHKIILLQEQISLDSRMKVQSTGFSRFKPKYTIQE